MNYEEINKRIVLAKKISDEARFITLAAAADELKIDLKSTFERAALAKAISSIDFEVRIIPSRKIEIKVRVSKEKKEKAIFTPDVKEDPISLNLDGFIGFIPRNKDIEKILTDRTIEDSSTPKTLGFDNALTSSSLSWPQWEAHRQMPRKKNPKKFEILFDRTEEYMDDYKYHEFYIEYSDIKNKVSDERIYLTKKDFEDKKGNLKNKTFELIENLYAELYPDPSNPGDYEINEWSNRLIKDLNCAFYHLHKATQNTQLNDILKKNNMSMEEVLSRWFKNRWEEQKDLLKTSTDQALRIILENDTKIKLDHFCITAKCKQRNQPRATDSMILIDFLAERIFKKEKSYYRNKDNFISIFDKAVSEKRKTLGHAIYSIAKAKAKP